MSRLQDLTSHFLLMCLRIILAAWIGAAVLYVMTSVAEQTSPNINSTTRDQLATIRFPYYYDFGFAVHIAAAMACGAAILVSTAGVRRRVILILAFLVLSGVLFCADYFFVYRPLQALIVPPGQARTQEFMRLHNLSRLANEAHLSAALAATLIAAWPVSRRKDSDPQADPQSTSG
ncbi:MAG: hypothetical protein R3C19_05355 [Planctomycetaceae bacterium]